MPSSPRGTDSHCGTCILRRKDVNPEVPNFLILHRFSCHSFASCSIDLKFYSLKRRD